MSGALQRAQPQLITASVPVCMDACLAGGQQPARHAASLQVRAKSGRRMHAPRPEQWWALVQIIASVIVVVCVVVGLGVLGALLMRRRRAMQARRASAHRCLCLMLSFLSAACVAAVECHAACVRACIRGDICRPVISAVPAP